MASKPLTSKSLALTVCALVSGCSEPKQLSDYSTEEIVEEYHARLDDIFEKTVEPGKTLFGLDPSPDEPLAEQLDEQRKVLEEQGKILESVLENLRPYADAGNVHAAAMVGIQLLTAEDKSITERCKGIKLLNEAAMQGHSGAALGLHGHFNMRHSFSDDEYFARLSYFWANEAARYTPAFEHVVEVFDVIWPAETLAEWSNAMQDWVPSEDTSVQNEIRLICASIEKNS